MNIAKTLKDIAHIPSYVRDIWYMVRDNGIDESSAHSRQTRHDKEMLEKINTLNKKQDDMWNLLATRFNKIDNKIDKLTVTIHEIHNMNGICYDAIVNNNDEMSKSSKQSEMASKTEIIEILRVHFDEINIDLDHHEIICNGEEVVSNMSSTIDDLTIQVNELSDTINQLKTIVQNLENKLYPQDKSEESIDVV
jgi:chaperonin cofactor prefoldin